MAADVFETRGEPHRRDLIGALTFGTASQRWHAMVYPFVLGGISVLGAVVGILFVNLIGRKPTSS